MKVKCITSCYHSDTCSLFNKGEIYEIDGKKLKDMLEQGMGKYFLTEDDKPIKATAAPQKKDKSDGAAEPV